MEIFSKEARTIAWTTKLADDRSMAQIWATAPIDEQRSTTLLSASFHSVDEIDETIGKLRELRNEMTRSQMELRELSPAQQAVFDAVFEVTQSYDKSMQAADKVD